MYIPCHSTCNISFPTTKIITFIDLIIILFGDIFPFALANEKSNGTEKALATLANNAAKALDYQVFYR